MRSDPVAFVKADLDFGVIAFAAGMFIALCCDHRFMTSGKGLVSANEVGGKPQATSSEAASYQ